MGFFVHTSLGFGADCHPCQRFRASARILFRFAFNFFQWFFESNTCCHPTCFCALFSGYMALICSLCATEGVLSAGAAKGRQQRWHKQRGPMVTL